MEYVSLKTCLKLSYLAKLCDSPSLSEIFVIFALDFINNTQCMLLKQRNPFLRLFQNKEKIVFHHKLISHTFQFPVFHGLPGNMQHPAYLSALFMAEFDFCFQLIQSLLPLLVSVLAPKTKVQSRFSTHIQAPSIRIWVHILKTEFFSVLSPSTLSGIRIIFARPDENA